jgi:hypothetical protein
MTSTVAHEIRFEPRRVRIPLLPIEMQRAFGYTFRQLSGFMAALRAAQDQGIDIVRAMTDAIVAELMRSARDEQAAGEKCDQRRRTLTATWLSRAFA